jgi:hypothetical protein
MWRGAAVVAKEGFSKRREYLNEFVKHHWVPDARLLGGIFTSIAQPMSLEEFSMKKDWTNCHSIEFIPELCGKRRMVWFLEAQVKAAEAHAGLKQGRQEPVVPAPAAVAPAPAAVAVPLQDSPEKYTSGRAIPVERLPDVYDLLGEDGAVFGRGSVQQFSLSRQLRESVKIPDGLLVTVKWNPEFSGYMITGLGV